MEMIVVIIFIIFEIIIYSMGRKSKQSDIDNIQKKYINEKKKIEDLINKLKIIIEKLNLEVNNKNKEITNMKDKIMIANTEIKKIPILAKLYSDLIEQNDEYLAKKLEEKKRPARKAAEEVREISKEKKVWIIKAKEMEYKCYLYESMFPSLPELVDDSQHEDDIIYQVVENEEGIQNNEDNIRLYLSEKEYNELPLLDKYQRALENWYFYRKKTKTRIGYDYECYVGYYMEKLGYNVEYYGQEQGLKDLGRDLICEKDGKMYIIQCKYWSKQKKIHENVVNQLLGTTLEICIRQMQEKYKRYNSAYDLIRDKIIIPRIVTNITLSDTAKSFAKSLGVEYMENFKLEMYPLIKCNINNGEKIYHLPFDQQYRRTDISKKDEFMALTVKEAENAGFRRAKRYYFHEF